MQKQISSKTIKTLKKLLRKHKEVLFCYLFGSQVTKNFIPESDVDLAIYLAVSKNKDFSNTRAEQSEVKREDEDLSSSSKRLELIGEISKVLKKQADIVVLNTAGPFLKYVILQQGKLIFEKDQAQRIDFELKSINEYFDFKPVMEEYNKRLLNV